MRKALVLSLSFPVSAGIRRMRDHARRSAIRALIDRWTKAAQEKNLDGVMSIYQRGPSLVAYDIVPPLQYKGWDAYRADY